MDLEERSKVRTIEELNEIGRSATIPEAEVILRKELDLRAEQIGKLRDEIDALEPILHRFCEGIEGLQLLSILRIE